MREHIQLAERIVASATAGGITATMSRVGESNIVVLCHAAGGRPVAVRISDFPARLLRGQLYDDLARAGWSGDAHIVDICGPARSTTGSAGTGGVSVLARLTARAQRGRTASRRLAGDSISILARLADRTQHDLRPPAFVEIRVSILGRLLGRTQP